MNDVTSAFKVEYDNEGTHYYIGDQEVDNNIFGTEIKKHFTINYIQEKLPLNNNDSYGPGPFYYHDDLPYTILNQIGENCYQYFKGKEMLNNFRTFEEDLLKLRKISDENLPITFNTFQEGTKWTAKYPNSIPTEVYTALGLAGETGEVLEKIKKFYRDGVNNKDEWKESLKKELGDVLYYLAALALSFDISLEDIADTNQRKLLLRLKNNAIHGSGDNRENENTSNNRENTKDENNDNDDDFVCGVI